MLENEVIIVNDTDQELYHLYMEHAVRYAIISLPFTINRMGKSGYKERAKNIAKGKLAECLFENFCQHNHIPADFTSCQTPYYQIDKNDFLLNGMSWDIKNNFLYHDEELLEKHHYTQLPALVPNRHEKDQWNRKSKEQSFVFTYIKAADTNRKKAQEHFFDIKLTDAQLDFIDSLYQQYKGLPQPEKPFDEADFWNEMNSRAQSNEYGYLQLNDMPHLVITAYASKSEWKDFENTGPNDTNNHFNKQNGLPWYQKTRNGTCNFLEGTLWTKIDNATCPVAQLPSFLSLFPHLHERINLAYIKNT